MKTTIEKTENSFYLFGRKFKKDTQYNENISLYCHYWEYSSIDDVRQYYRKISTMSKVTNFAGDILNPNSFIKLNSDDGSYFIYPPRAINGDKEWTRHRTIEIKIQYEKNK